MTKSTTNTFLVALALLQQAFAFSVSTLAPRSSSLSLSQSTGRTRLFATVYGPDGGREEEYHNSYMYEDSNTINQWESRSSSKVIETLSRDNRDSLARLAVAFSRKDHGFTLDTIDSVHILDIGHAHITLSVVLCDNMGCVTVAVPVAFPNPCVAPTTKSTTTNFSFQGNNNDDVDDSCIMENVFQLDTQAKVVLETVDWESNNHEQLAHYDRVQEDLSSSDKVADYPTWWVDAGFFLQDDCENIKRLLNSKDFQAELVAVADLHVTEELQAQKLLQDKQEENGNDSIHQVEQVGVALVGPNGLVLRAQVKHMTLYDEKDWITTYDVPVPFATEANNVEDLRTRVLELVESVATD